jgi:hypothetical protein
MAMISVAGAMSATSMIQLRRGARSLANGIDVVIRSHIPLGNDLSPLVERRTLHVYNSYTHADSRAQGMEMSN